jgi:hypothetical protein
MATTGLVPLSECVSATHHPGRDHIEGRLEERDVEVLDHCDARRFWSGVEVRVPIDADRFRVHGVTLVRGGKPSGRIVATPLAGGIRLAEAAEGSLTMPGVPSDRQDDEEDAGHRIN